MSKNLFELMAQQSVSTANFLPNKKKSSLAVKSSLKNN